MYALISEKFLIKFLLTFINLKIGFEKFESLSEYSVYEETDLFNIIQVVFQLQLSFRFYLKYLY